MSEQPEFDLVAIGGGFAGLVAAVRGAELGLRTAVIEKGADERYLCSSRWAGGIFHVSYHDVKLAPEALVEAIDKQTSGEADPQLVAAIAHDAGRVVDWLAIPGAPFIRPSSDNRLTNFGPIFEKSEFPMRWKQHLTARSAGTAGPW